MTTSVELLSHIPKPDPKKQWGVKWRDDWKPIKGKAREWRQSTIQEILDMEEEPDNFLALKADVTKCFTNRFPDKQWPSKCTTTEKRQYGQEILMPVIAKWGPAFNIPIHHPSFFDLLYGLVKLNVKQASAKIKVEDGVPLTPTPQKSSLPTPSPQPSREPIGLSNRLDTPMLDVDDTGHGPASPTIELSTPIRHQLSRKPTARRHALGRHFADTALSQMSPSIPVKLPKYDEHCAIIVIRKDGKDLDTVTLSQFQRDGAKEPATFAQFDYDKLLARLCAKGIVDLESETLALGNGRSAFSGKQVSPHFEMFILLMAAYNERHHPLIFDVVPALHLKQSKRRAVSERSTDGTDHPSTDNDDASDAVRPGRSGKLNAEPLVDEEIAAAKLDRNAALSEAFAERSARESTIIRSLGDNARQDKLATIPEEDSEEEKDDDTAKSKDDTFDTPAALEEYMNLAAKAVEEGEDGSHFQVVDPVAGLTEEEVAELLNHDFAMQSEDRVSPVDEMFDKIKGKNAKTEHLTKENWSLMCTIFKRDETDFKTQITLPGFKHTLYLHQVLLITWCFTQHRDFFGGIIGDEQGLGKTYSALLLITFNHLLVQNARDIKNDRKDNAPQRRHRADGESGPCPSAKHWPIQCRCEVGSCTAKLPFRLGPTLIVAPAPLLSNWTEEFDNLFDGNPMGPCPAMILLIGHTSAPSAQRPGYGRNMTKLRTEKAVTEKGDKDIYIGHSDQTQYIILTTSGSVEGQILNVVGHFEEVQVKYIPPRSRKVCIRTSMQLIPNTRHISWAMVVIDELHLIKNEKSHFHRTILRRLRGQPMLWAMSGTPFEKGPADLGTYIKFLRRNWKTNIDPSDETKKAYDLCSEENLQNIQFAFNALQRQQTAKGGDYVMSTSELANLQAWVDRFGLVLEAIMIRRTGDSLGLDGKPLVELPKLNYNNQLNCVLPDPVQQDKVVKDVEAFIDDLRAVLRLEREKQKEEWERKHPGQSCPIGWAVGRFEALQYQTRPICSFPGLMKIKKEFKGGWNLHNLDEKGWFDDNSTDSPIKRHIDMLYDTSAKLHHLDQVLNEMYVNNQAIIQNPTDQNGKKKKKDKIVIISCFPVCTLIVYEWVRKFHPEFHVAIYGSHQRPKHRQAIIHSYQETMTVSGNRVVRLVPAETDIIVGTIGTIGTGHTLHYGRRITLLEPQHLLTHEEQAIKRAHRLGQDREVIANRMVNKDMMLEAILSNKTALRKFIASVMQPPTADDEQNAAHFTSELHKDKRAAEKSKAANERRRKDKERAEEQSFYDDDSMII